MLTEAASSGDLTPLLATSPRSRTLGDASPYLSDGSFYRRYRGPGFVPPPREQSWVHASFILVAELVGTGVLALPHTFAIVGVPLGVATLIIFSFLGAYSGLLLYRLQAWFPQGITYGDCAFEVLGRTGQQIVFGFIYIAFFGNLAIYILVCAETLQNLFYDHLEWCKWWYTLGTVLFLLPFCQLRTLHHVSYVASASAVAIFLALATVLLTTFTDDRVTSLTDQRLDIELANRNDGGAGGDELSLLKVIASISTAVFAFGGQGLYFETMAEMRQPDHFPRSVVVTTALILAVYLIVSVSCTYVYGTHVEGNILFALPNGPAKRFAAFLLFFHVCISYVLAQQVIGRAIHVRITHHEVIDSGSKLERQQWFCISASLLLLSFFIANGIPFFSSLMGLVGAISTAPLTFGFPAYMTWSAWNGKRKLRRQDLKLSKLELPLLLLFIVFAAFFAIAGSITSVLEMVEKWNTLGYPFECHAHI
mmetsp:Transcript_6195/g.11006  ORF Transcript_6195/g.11006 Transcript_6195/m.11006 type:complete len:479 (-) Transcript_6195:63-1499(-)|eukprot:CAMPEP_0184547822 /NCGR_PEP_ID=MMETSP0199_2-20130426/5818_1 /TAXON_ID=1112570 /ORGANISM="Thraustochytrium sp., Strain LLF1b" /LENGTH=478 /DNA_ID=CAMNT_0026942361 /DNA_START=239 /DNA_END=1675 /DNA_ORIENTATION=-